MEIDAISVELEADVEPDLWVEGGRAVYISAAAKESLRQWIRFDDTVW